MKSLNKMKCDYWVRVLKNRDTIITEPVNYILYLITLLRQFITHRSEIVGVTLLRIEQCRRL